MENNLHINADRFWDFADVYDSARPKCPEKVNEMFKPFFREDKVLNREPFLAYEV